MTKEYFTQTEVIEDIIGALENGYSGYLCDLHNDVFNSDYYIIGTHKAKEALEEYGTFEAIQQIITYEKNHFGEVFTDVSEPERVANMLYYIQGEGVTNDLASEFDELWNEEVNNDDNPEIVEYLRELL